MRDGRSHLLMATPSADPEALREKLRSWREGGMNVFSFSYGGGSRQDFHDLPSVAQRERDHVSELKAAGIEFERARH